MVVQPHFWRAAKVSERAPRDSGRHAHGHGMASSEKIVSSENRFLDLRERNLSGQAPTAHGMCGVNSDRWAISLHWFRLGALDTYPSTYLGRRFREAHVSAPPITLPSHLVIP